MYRLAALLNFITLPIAHRIAFEAASYPLTSRVEHWSDDVSTVALLFGKLRIIAN